MTIKNLKWGRSETEWAANLKLMIDGLSDGGLGFARHELEKIYQDPRCLKNPRIDGKVYQFPTAEASQ